MIRPGTMPSKCLRWKFQSIIGIAVAIVLVSARAHGDTGTAMKLAADVDKQHFVEARSDQRGPEWAAS